MLKKHLDRVTEIKNKYQNSIVEQDINDLISIIEDIYYPLYLVKLKNATIDGKSSLDQSLCSYCYADLQLREIYDCTSELTTEVWYCYGCENRSLWLLNNANLSY